MEKSTYDEQTSSELKDALNNDKMKLSVLNAIELSAITYFESLRRLWKVEKRSEKKEISNKQNRRDARIQRVCAVLRVNHIIL